MKKQLITLFSTTVLALFALFSPAHAEAPSEWLKNAIIFGIYPQSGGGGPLETVSGVANQIEVINGSGPNVVVGFVNNPIVPGNGAITIPQGTTAQRTTPSNGIRYNSETGDYEAYYPNIPNWVVLASESGAGNMVADGTIAAGGTFPISSTDGFHFTDSPLAFDGTNINAQNPLFIETIAEGNNPEILSLANNGDIPNSGVRIGFTGYNSFLNSLVNRYILFNGDNWLYQLTSNGSFYLQGDGGYTVLNASVSSGLQGHNNVLDDNNGQMTLNTNGIAVTFTGTPARTLDLTNLNEASPYVDQYFNFHYPNASVPGNQWAITDVAGHQVIAALVDGTQQVNFSGPVNINYNDNDEYHALSVFDVDNNAALDVDVHYQSVATNNVDFNVYGPGPDFTRYFYAGGYVGNSPGLISTRFNQLDDGTGRVGIGIAPNYALDIGNVGTVPNSAMRMLSSANTPSTPSNANDLLFWNNAGTYRIWNATGNEILAIDQTANVYANNTVNLNTPITYATPGTCTATNGSPTITLGIGTEFNKYFEPQDPISLDGGITNYRVLTVDSDIQITLTTNFGQTTASGLTAYSRQAPLIYPTPIGVTGIDASGYFHVNDSVDIPASITGLTGKPMYSGVTESNTDTLMLMTSYFGQGSLPYVGNLFARGTIASPTSVDNGDVLMGIVGAGYDGTNYIQNGTLQWTVDTSIAPVSAGVIPTRFDIWNTDSAGNYNAILTGLSDNSLQSLGRVGIGGTPLYSLDLFNVGATPDASIHFPVSTNTPTTPVDVDGWVMWNNAGTMGITDDGGSFFPLLAGGGGGSVIGPVSSHTGALTVFADTSGQVISEPLFTPTGNSLIGYAGTDTVAQITTNTVGTGLQNTGSLLKTLLGNTSTSGGTYTATVSDVNSIINFTGSGNFVLPVSSTCSQNDKIYVKVNTAGVAVMANTQGSDTLFSNQAPMGIVNGQIAMFVNGSGGWNAVTMQSSQPVINKKTNTDYTILPSDANSIIIMNGTSYAPTATLPRSDLVWPGYTVDVVQYSVGSVTVVTAGGDQILTHSGLSSSLIMTGIGRWYTFTVSENFVWIYNE